MTPTQRTLSVLRERGCRAQVVEHWVPRAMVRRDLFGIADILAITPAGETIAVQCTTGSNVAARIRKIAHADALPDLRRAGWRIMVHGWRKSATGLWTLREVDVS